MDDKLDRYLVLKYPKLFVNRYKTPMESCLSFGFECGDGWFDFIYDLSKKIIELDRDIQFFKEKKSFGGLSFYTGQVK